MIDLNWNLIFGNTVLSQEAFGFLDCFVLCFFIIAARLYANFELGLIIDVFNSVF